MSTIGQFDAIYNILIVVTFVTLIAWRLKFPPTLALIIAGILASVSTRIFIPELSAEIFISLLLPPILFQETLHLEIDDLIKDADSVLAFAIIGTVIMQLAVAAFSYYFFSFGLLESLLFGIMISPTDPVAVIRVFHNLDVDKRFQIIVSGESLFNDGIAIVIYSILITLITHDSITAFQGAYIAARTIIGGIAIGLLSGYLIHSVYCWTNDNYAEVLISFLAAFGLFRLAEELGASGVLAIVVSGILINYRTRKYGGLGGDAYDMFEKLWEFVGFLASSIAFIFIGMNLDKAVFISNLTFSVILFAAILTFRILMVEIVAYLLERYSGVGFSRDWRNGFVWSGLRGAISIVLVLGISGLVPSSDVMTAITFGVVILSNVIQGISIGFLIKKADLICIHCLDQSVVDSSSHLSEGYNPIGFDPTKGLYEKLLFSSPEYFIRDTKFGVWLAGKLVQVLVVLNNYSLEGLPKRTFGVMSKLIMYCLNMILSFLNWINHYLLKWESND